MTQPVFLYGALLDPDICEIVSGAPFAARAASLPGASVRLIAGAAFSTLTDMPGSVAHGVVVDLDDSARMRVDFYQLGFGFGVATRDIQTEGGTIKAVVHVPKIEPDASAPWSLEHWQAEHGDQTRLVARELMSLMPTHGPEAAARALPQIQMRAASHLRARSFPSPEPFTPHMSERTVTPERTEQPYTDYFAVREDWLSFPKFDGGQGPVVKRASFLAGDAVTVLPYDPATDSVLVIRQFRHGSFARGDTNPWTLEPAAGRIDPGEMPEDAARRELMEETGVTTRDLHFVGRYYPSPGAYSEYLYSYIGIADLSSSDGGIGGLDEEAEDIMRHVVPLSDALDMVASGAANTGPLILSLGWLALNKSRLI